MADRGGVRAGIVTTLTNAQSPSAPIYLPYVGSIFPARPVFASGVNYVQTMQGMAIQESQNGSACVLVVNILNDYRFRYALVGRGPVADFDKHRVELELFFSSQFGTGNTQQDPGIAAQDDYDTIYSALTAIIRANPTMSAPEYVWSAGEYRYGIQHEQSVAFNPGQSTSVLINGVMRYEAWEQIVGSGV